MSRRNTPMSRYWDKKFAEKKALRQGNYLTKGECRFVPYKTIVATTK